MFKGGERVKRMYAKNLFAICPNCREKAHVEIMRNNIATGKCNYCGTIIEIKLRPATETDKKGNPKTKRKKKALGEPVELRPTVLHKGYE